jgi:hypothetical protein
MNQKAFEAVWASEDLTILDKVAETLKLGSPEAAAILIESAKADKNAPQKVPEFVKDAKKNTDTYLRANLALAFARDLGSARVYEEAREALDSIQPEQVVEPSTYFFHKAVAEHALIL